MSRRSYRIRNLTLAAVLAVAAAILATIAASHARGGTAKQAVAGVSVLVATRDLAVGASAGAALAGGEITARRVPADSVVQDPVTPGTALKGLTVLQPVFAGEQLTRRRLGPSGAQGVRSELHGPLRILQVPGSATQLLAGTVRAGDHVDVVAALKRGTQQTSYARIVLRDLLVLEAPPAAADTSARSAPQTLSITVELTDDQVERLFYVVDNGRWSLVLRPPANGTSRARGPVSAETLLAGR